MCDHLSMDELNTAERLLVLSFRLWALPHAVPDQAHPEWRAGLRAAGLEGEAQLLFDPLLDTLFSSTQRVIEVHRAMCLGISQDESEFLRCIAMYQNARDEDARQILADWIPPASMRLATCLAASLADALKGAALMLPVRESDRMSLLSTAAGIGRGLHLVH